MADPRSLMVEPFAPFVFQKVTFYKGLYSVSCIPYSLQKLYRCKSFTLLFQVSLVSLALQKKGYIQGRDKGIREGIRSSYIQGVHTRKGYGIHTRDTYKEGIREGIRSSYIQGRDTGYGIHTRDTRKGYIQGIRASYPFP